MSGNEKVEITQEEFDSTYIIKKETKEKDKDVSEEQQEVMDKADDEIEEMVKEEW